MTIDTNAEFTDYWSNPRVCVCVFLTNQGFNEIAVKIIWFRLGECHIRLGMKLWLSLINIVIDSKKLRDCLSGQVANSSD